MHLPKFLQRCPLVGVRDWGTAYDWVPCPSCLSPAFDDQPQERHKVGFYEHWEIPLQNPGEPLQKNNCEFNEAIAFLSSCETVVTNTYHGAYWATLLGKKVLVEPINSKLLNMKHQPRVILNRDWKANQKYAVAYPEALADCRAANISFSRRVSGLLLRIAKLS
ncbi:MAG: polysaccharide pyruvyl transferase family protein [Candidatus Obscuribacterales bacterium]|nr:polysaccharide pyruvyl transferase family protein [Candidatus Obscuribacterales bacterium]